MAVIFHLTNVQFFSINCNHMVMCSFLSLLYKNEVCNNAVHDVAEVLRSASTIRKHGPTVCIKVNISLLA